MRIELVAICLAAPHFLSCLLVEKSRDFSCRNELALSLGSDRVSSFWSRLLASQREVALLKGEKTDSEQRLASLQSKM